MRAHAPTPARAMRAQASVTTTSLASRTFHRMGAAASVVREMWYTHPVFSSEALRTQAELPKFKQAMEELLPRLTPGLVFNDRQLRTIGARQWIYLDSTVPAVDTSIRNLMYLSDLGGHMIGVNFNATVAEFASQQAGFEVAARTLRVD